MATTETKIVEIKVPLGDALNQITALTAGINKLTDETKKLDKSNADEAKQIEINKLTIKDYQNQKRQLTNEVMKEVKVSNDAIGAYQKLQNEYSKAAAKAKDLAIQHGAGSEKATKAAEAAKAMNDRLKEADVSVGLHVRNVGNYAESLSFLGGKMGGVINYITTFNETISTTTTNLTTLNQQNNNTTNSFTSFTQNIKQAGSGVLAFGKQLLLLLANPIVLFIGAIVGSLVLLQKAFMSTDSGAVAFAGAMKAVGNVLDILLDRTVSYFKLLGSIATFDWEGIKKNATAAFGGITKSIKDATVAGFEFESQMDSIADRESASLIRSAKLRAEIEKLKNQSKDANLTIQQRLSFSELAMKKEIELNGIEKGFLKERNETELKNLAAKIQVNGMTTKQKEQQIREWLKLDDRQIEQYAKNNARFADFIDKNETEFQALQKLKSDEYNKDAEFEQGTRRLQKESSTFKASLLKEEADKTKQNEELKRAEIEKTNAVKEKQNAITQAEIQRLDELRQYIRSTVSEMSKVENALTDIQKAQLQIVVKGGNEILKAVTDNAAAVLNASVVNSGKKAVKTEEEKQKEIDDAKKVKDAKIQSAFDTANAAADILQGSFAYADALAQNELALWAAQNKGKANFDEEYAKKKAEIDHKQAVRNKIMQIVNSTINGAGAVVALLATPPLAIAAGIAAALQIAAIIATPIPSPEATSGGGGGAKTSSLPPDLTSKMASPLGSSVSAIQSNGGSNAITSGAANVAVAKANEPAIYAPKVELSIVELRTKERQVDFIDNVSTLKS